MPSAALSMVDLLTPSLAGSGGASRDGATLASEFAIVADGAFMGIPACGGNPGGLVWQ